MSCSSRVQHTSQETCPGPCVWVYEHCEYPSETSVPVVVIEDKVANGNGNGEQEIADNDGRIAVEVQSKIQ